MISTASSGEVLLNHPLGQPTEPAVDGFTTFGNTSLSGGASLDTSADRAGRIVIRAGQFTTDDASIKAISEGGEWSLGRATASPAIRLRQSLSPQNGTHITAIATDSAGGDITFNVATLTTEGDATNHILLNPDSPSNWAQNLITSDNRSPAVEQVPQVASPCKGSEGLEPSPQASR